jgi:hypothetical protein
MNSSSSVVKTGSSTKRRCPEKKIKIIRNKVKRKRDISRAQKNGQKKTKQKPSSTI